MGRVRKKADGRTRAARVKKASDIAAGRAPKSLRNVNEAECRRAFQELQRSARRVGLNAAITESHPRMLKTDDPIVARVLGVRDAEDVDGLPALVDDLRKEDNIDIQIPALYICLKRVLQFMDPTAAPREPRWEQLRVLRRLIFLGGDALLVARTGFGKSIIFHAFTVLTGKMTLQIVPLNKLGEEQTDDIRLIPGMNPCVITRDTKGDDQELLCRITAGEFTHILLGPEQASTKEFRAALKTPELQSRIGLVAIDECHLVSEWGDGFRPQFMMLAELRMVLGDGVAWFGCSASLPDHAEKIVLEGAGFSPVGLGYGKTEVIRTPVDRPDVSFGMYSIPKGTITLFDRLWFLLDESVGSGSEATPSRIPKTIVFIDDRAKVRAAALFLRNALLRRSEAATIGTGYTASWLSKERCVTNVVEEYTSRVAALDQCQRYREFKSETSCIRIMVATTSLGMGVNVPDVARVVVWGFPRSDDPSDVWQKLGRGGRGDGRRSMGYIFLPYWAFESEGREKLSSVQSTEGSQQTIDGDRTQAVDSDSQQTVDGGAVNTVDTRPYWTKDDMERRSGLSLVWRKILDAPCHRHAFLEYLGEHKLLLVERPPPVEPEKCCNRCSEALRLEFPAPPSLPKSPSRPVSKTRPWFALQYIEKWVADEAERVYDAPDRRFPIPGYAILRREMQWALAGLWQREKYPAISTDILHEKVAGFSTWRFSHTHGPALVEMLSQARPVIHAEHEAYSQEQTRKRREARATRQAGLAPRGASPSGGVAAAVANSESSNVAEYRRAVHRRDDLLAIAAARRYEQNQQRRDSRTVASPRSPAVVAPKTPQRVHSVMTSPSPNANSSSVGEPTPSQRGIAGYLPSSPPVVAAAAAVADSQVAVADTQPQSQSIVSDTQCDSHELVCETQHDIQTVDADMPAGVTPIDMDSLDSMPVVRSAHALSSTATTQARRAPVRRSRSATPRRQPLSERSANVIREVLYVQTKSGRRATQVRL